MGNREIEFIMKLRDQASAEWKKTVGQMEAGFNKLKTQVGKFGALIAGAFSVAAVQGMIRAFNEQENASARLTQALRNAGVTSKETQAEMERFSSQMQKLTVYGDEVVTNVQAMLTAMTGLTGQAVQPLTKAALDLASGLKIDAESAANLIAKTVEGQDALGRYGISVKGAKDESERLAMITDQVRQKFGGFAEAEAKTAAGQMKQFQNAVGDLQEEFGKLLASALTPIIPIFQRMIEFLTSAPPAIQAMVLATGALTAAFFALNIPLGGLPIALGALVVALTGLSVWVAKNIEKVREFADTIKYFGVIGFAWSNIIKGITWGIDTLTGATEKSKKEFAELTTVVRSHDQSYLNYNKTQKLVEGSLNAINDRLKKHREALGNLIPGTNAYINQLIKIQREQEKLNELEAQSALAAMVRWKGISTEVVAAEVATAGYTKTLQKLFSNTVPQSIKSGVAEVKASIGEITVTFEEQFGVLGLAIVDAADVLRSNFSKAWNDIFGEANSLLEQFLQRFLTRFADKFVNKLTDDLLNIVSGVIPGLRSGGSVVSEATRLGGRTLQTASQIRAGAGPIAAIATNPLAAPLAAFAAFFTIIPALFESDFEERIERERRQSAQIDRLFEGIAKLPLEIQKGLRFVPYDVIEQFLPRLLREFTPEGQAEMQAEAIAKVVDAQQRRLSIARMFDPWNEQYGPRPGPRNIVGPRVGPPQSPGGQGTTLVFNFNSPVGFEDAMLASLKRVTGKTGLTVDQLTVNNNGRLEFEG